MIHEQDNIKYRIVDDVLRGWRGTSPFKKPMWDGTSIVEGWTQADEDAEAEAIEERTVRALLDQFEADGNRFYNKVSTRIRVLFQKKRISKAQYKILRRDLQPALQHLKEGNWDLAQDAIASIKRPTGRPGAIYDFVKSEVKLYVNPQF